MATENIMTNGIYEYLFHYNIYQSKWFAFKRDDKEKYFNGVEIPGLLSDGDINNLIKQINNK